MYFGQGWNWWLPLNLCLPLGTWVLGPRFLIILFSKHPGSQLLSTKCLTVGDQQWAGAGASNQRNDIWEGFVQFTEFLWKFWWWKCIWNIDKLSLETVTFKLVATANNRKLWFRGLLEFEIKLWTWDETQLWVYTFKFELTLWQLNSLPACPALYCCN